MGTNQTITCSEIDADGYHTLTMYLEQGVILGLRQKAQKQGVSIEDLILLVIDKAVNEDHSNYPLSAHIQDSMKKLPSS